MPFQLILIGALIFVAGIIDSIAGGGGLISLPAVALLTGEGVAAVATNKVLAVASATTALTVYWLHGHVRLKRSLVFVVSVGAAGVLGAKAGSYLTPQIFRLMVLTIFPCMLVVIFKRESLLEPAAANQTKEPSLWLLISIGAFCGFYDGCFGPGGGTLMFLSLAVIARMPLLEALGSSKLANTFSSVASLSTYALSGFVQWRVGAWLAVCICFGSLIGSRLASTRAKQVIKPVLALVVALLIIKIVFL